MTGPIISAIDNLFELMRKEVQDNLVSINIFFNHEGYNIETNFKDANELKDHCISMKNLKGEWLK